MFCPKISALFFTLYVGSMASAVVVRTAPPPSLDGIITGQSAHPPEPNETGSATTSDHAEKQPTETENAKRSPHRHPHKQHAKTSPAPIKARGAFASTAPSVLTSDLGEQRPADETGRPEWTSHRRFGNTRVYLQQAPGEFGVEQWWRMQRHHDGTTANRLQEEVEIGLPWRMQLDIYGNIKGDEHRDFHFDNVALELRWALADWGRIPLNPTLYGEYKIKDKSYGSDVFEFKLLLGTDLTPKLHWGFNFSREADLGGEKDVEWELTQGLSYSVIDDVLGVGVEMEYGDESVAGHRGEPERRFLIGPTIQLRPTKNTHIDLVAMWSTTQDGPGFQSFVIFGYDFGRIAGERHYEPTTTRGN